MSHQILMHYFGSDLLEHPITLETAVVYRLGLWWPCYQFWNHVGEYKLLKCETFKLLYVYLNDRNNFRKTKKEHSLPLFAFILLEFVFLFLFYFFVNWVYWIMCSVIYFERLKKLICCLCAVSYWVKVRRGSHLFKVSIRDLFWLIFLPLFVFRAAVMHWYL